MSLPRTGMTQEQIVEALVAKRATDVRWQDGRTFGMVYDAGPEAHRCSRPWPPCSCTTTR